MVAALAIDTATFKVASAIVVEHMGLDWLPSNLEEVVVPGKLVHKTVPFLVMANQRTAAVNILVIGRALAEATVGSRLSYRQHDGSHADDHRGAYHGDVYYALL